MPQAEAMQARPPAALGDVVDLGHLGHYTMGDVKLERELLKMFSGQAEELRARLRAADDDAEWKLASHTLKGAAMAVGAFAIAQAAKELEEAGRGAPEELMCALDGHLEEFRAAFAHWERQSAA